MECEVGLLSLYSNAILTDAPLAYYRLGESSGTTAYDSSGNGYNSTITGGVTLGQSGALALDTSGAMLLDGSTGCVVLPSGVNPSGWTAFTLEIWIKITTIGTNFPRLISNAYPNSSNTGIDFGINPQSGGGFVTIGTGASFTQVGFSQPWQVGTWYHLAATYDGATIKVYVNGALSSSSAASGTIAAAAQSFAIGRNNSYNGDYFPGTVDEAAIYNTTLSATRIQAGYTIAKNTVITSLQNAFRYKTQVVKAYDPSGNFLGVIPDAPYLTGYKENVNGASDAVRMVLPRKIDAYDGANQPNSKNTIVLGNTVQWWLYGAGLPASGKLRYAGVIDTITPKVDEQGAETVEVLVTSFTQILGDHAVTSTLTFGTAGSSGTYIDTGAIFSSFFTGSYTNSVGTVVSTIDSITGHPYGYPFTLDPMGTTATNQKTQYAFQNQTLLSALTDTLLLSPTNYFFRLNPDKTVYLGQYATNATYTLYIGQHITSINYSIDNVPRKNVIVVQGKGVAATAVGSSVSTIGQRVYFKSDNRITDATTAQTLANGILAFYDRPLVRATVKIPDYRGDALAGLGYDIEKFRVGETVKIVDTKAPATSVTGTGATWGSFVWGRDKWGASAPAQSIWGAFNWGSAAWGTSLGGVFNAILPIVAINYDYYSVTLELGMKQPSLNRKLYDLEARFADASLVS